MVFQLRGHFFCLILPSFSLGCNEISTFEIKIKLLQMAFVSMGVNYEYGKEESVK